MIGELVKRWYALISAEGFQVGGDAESIEVARMIQNNLRGWTKKTREGLRIVQFETRKRDVPV